MPGLFNYEDPSAQVFEDHHTILSDLDDSEWDLLIGCMERKRFLPGASIVRMGERDCALYLIVAGTVNVVIESAKGPIEIASIIEGSVFGEIAFFDREPRSAHVFARDHVEVLTLGPERLEQLAAWHPRIAHKLLMDLGRTLSRRLRKFYQG